MTKSLRWVLGILAFGALSAAVLRAQDVTGTWQGVLQAGGRELRQVIKITREDAGGLRAVLYSIDQGGQGFAGSTTVDGSTVRMSFAAIGITYEGRLGADGNSISGTATQGPGKNPLNLARVSGDAAWAIPAAPATLKPMAAGARPGFEVATIKPSRPDVQGKGFTMKGRQVITINTNLSDLMTFAYSIHARQIVNAPDWAAKDHYDITGIPDAEGQPGVEHMRSMLQKLLADRFKLTFHRDKQELSVYALMVGRDGPKLTRSGGDPNGPPGLIFRGLGVLPGVNASMADLASVMQGAVLDRPVVDQTGITGKFDFTLTWTPDESQFRGMGVRVPPPPDTATAPSLFTAIQEQLGLRLESTKAPAEVLIIDRVEKPTEN
jgi:uncharacterized protein (TIGR03435 family)